MACDRVDLVTVDTRVASVAGTVYSTDPHRAEGVDSNSYIIKGPDPEVVFAELAGCVMAYEVGLGVPDVAICHFDGQRFAGSKKCEIRDVTPWLKRPQKIQNIVDLYRIIVVDTWLANFDRNMGNIVAQCSRRDEIRLLFIDFEKSTALHPNPLTSCAVVKPQSLWPSGELGQYLLRSKPLVPPTEIVERINGFDEDDCRGIIGPIERQLNGVTWADHCAGALSRRARQIKTLLEEVWDSN